MEKLSFRFRREEHLKGRSRIREVFSKGKRYFETGAKLYVLPNNLPYNCICFSFTGAGSRNLGSAVARNRAKRLGREAYRLMKGAGQIAAGYDLILQFNPNSSEKITLSDRTEQLQSLFKKAGLLK